MSTYGDCSPPIANANGQKLIITDLLNVPILVTEVAACVRPNVSDRAISLASLESSFLQ
jgi:hypothetical protein